MQRSWRTPRPLENNNRQPSSPFLEAPPTRISNAGHKPGLETVADGDRFYSDRTPNPKPERLDPPASMHLRRRWFGDLAPHPEGVTAPRGGARIGKSGWCVETEANTSTRNRQAIQLFGACPPSELVCSIVASGFKALRAARVATGQAKLRLLA